MANSPAIRRSGALEGQEFIYRPAGSAMGNVYTSWAACHTAASAYRGLSRIRIDSPGVGAQIPAGIWDMRDIVISGFEHVTTSGPNDILEVQDGASFTNLARIEGPLRFESVSSSPAMTVGSPHSLICSTGVIMRSNGAPLIDVLEGNLFYLTLLEGSQIQGPSAVVEMENLSVAVVQLFSGSLVSFNTFSGTPQQVSVFLFSSAAQFNENHVGLGAQPTINLLADSERVSYDPTASGLVSTDVQGAIDELAQDNASGSGSLGRRTYGNVFVVWSGFNAPLTVNALVSETSIKRGNVDLIRNVEKYSRCQWRMEFIDSTPPVVFDDLSFGSQQDIVDWVNANVPQAGGFFTESCHLAAYDQIDGDLPPIFKVMGKNRTFSRWRNFFRYWSSGQVVNTTPQLLQDLWTFIYGAPLPTPVGSWTDEYGLFWTPQNHKRLYQLPALGFTLGLQGGPGQRRMRLPDDSISPATTGEWTTDPGFSPGYVASDATQNTSDLFDAASAERHLALNLAQGNSIVIGYPMTDGLGNRALYLKPVGIDTFHTNWYDPSQYRLEAVGAYARDGHIRIHPLTSPQSTPQASLNSGGLFSLSEVMTSVAFSNSSNLRGQKPGPVAFQLRDLMTNRVSALAHPRIQWDYKKRFRPLAAIVRNHATR